MTTTTIIGGAGKTGSRVARGLRSAGHPVRLASRTGDVHFDWTDEATWDEALEGAGRVYVTFQPDLGLPGADEIIGSFARRAVASGTSRLVLLSGRGEAGAARAEAALAASGAAWTVIRSAFFLQNFTEAHWRHEIATGRMAMLRHEAVEPFVDAEDVAAVAVAALTDDRHIGATYELTGPATLAFRDVATAVAAASGIALQYEELGVDDYVRHLAASGMPGDDAAGLAYLFDEVLDGRNAFTTTDVADVLGRPPRGMGHFLASLDAREDVGGAR